MLGVEIDSTLRLYSKQFYFSNLKYPAESFWTIRGSVCCTAKDPIPTLKPIRPGVGKNLEVSVECAPLCLHGSL